MPTKKEMNNIGTVAKGTVGMPFVTKFNTSFFMRRQKLSTLVEMDPVSEVRLCEANSIQLDNGKVAKDQTVPQTNLSQNEMHRQSTEENYVDIDYVRTNRNKTYHHDNQYENLKYEENNEMESVEGRMTNLELKVENINRTLNDRFNVILKTLNKIVDKNMCVHKDCKHNHDVATNSSSDLENEDIHYENESLTNERDVIITEELH